MKIRFGFSIKMRWYDPRLTFANLNEMEDINIINVGIISSVAKT